MGLLLIMNLISKDKDPIFCMKNYTHYGYIFWVMPGTEGSSLLTGCGMEGTPGMNKM